MCDCFRHVKIYQEVQSLHFSNVVVVREVVVTLKTTSKH